MQHHFTTSSGIIYVAVKSFFWCSVFFLTCTKMYLRYFPQDTGSVLMPTDIKYYQEFGGEKVVFEKEEIAEMKKFSDPGM